MEAPDVYILSQMHWQFWGTLTFKRELPGRVVECIWVAWLRELSVWSGLKDCRRLMWIRRAENGELTGRYHLHALLQTGNPRLDLSRTAFALKRKWEALGGGIARVYVHEGGSSALSYMLKGPSLRDGAEQYEARKFGDGQSGVTLSEGLSQCIAARKRKGVGQEMSAGCRQRTTGDTVEIA